MHDIFPPIETARLTLRCVRLEDAPAISAMMVPDVSRWMASWPSPLRVDMAEARITKGRAAAMAGNSMPFAVERRSDRSLLGLVMIMRLPDQADGSRARGSLAYWFGTAYHGQGYAREAVTPAIDAALFHLRLEVIEAALQQENAPSIAVLKGCGMHFTHEGTMFAETRNRDERVLFYETAPK